MGRKREDLTGRRYGRLTVISYNEEVSKQKKITYWNCKCDCGSETIVYGGNLKCGSTISCGCYAREKAKEVMREMVKEKWQDEDFRRMRSERMSGVNSPHWKGGITPIKEHLGGLLVVEQWRSNSKQQVNYTCELTGKAGGVNTHHLKAFNTIVLEAHELHNIQIKPQVKDYTEEELHKLEEYVASWHKDSSNAVVLSEEVHKLFHSLYGQGGNTPEQYEEFRERYIAGEFEGLI